MTTLSTHKYHINDNGSLVMSDLKMLSWRLQKHDFTNQLVMPRWLGSSSSNRLVRKNEVQTSIICHQKDNQHWAKICSNREKTTYFQTNGDIV